MILHTPKLVIVVVPRLLLKIIDYSLVHLESFGENLRRNRRISFKQSICNSDSSWILTAKASNGNSIAISHIQLEMNQTNWEHKHITLVQHFGEEAISILIGSHKSNIKSTLKDYKDLSAARVSVGSVQTLWCKIYASQSYAKRV